MEKLVISTNIKMMCLGTLEFTLQEIDALFLKYANVKNNTFLHANWNVIIRE